MSKAEILTPADAVRAVIADAWNDRKRSRTDYLRLCRALQVLNVEPHRHAEILEMLAYVDASGTLYERYHVGFRKSKAA